MSTRTAARRRRWLAPEVVQTSAMDCGPAALKCLLEGHGLPVRYGRLREACQTSVDGTSIDTLEVVARQLGLQVEQRMLPPDVLFLDAAASLPALVVVLQHDGATHFVVAWRRVGPWLQLMDPALGRRWVRVERFRQDLFRHHMEVPAPAWRDWADSDEFRLPLEQQLRHLGDSAAGARQRVAQALLDAHWRGPATLEAGVRLAQELCAAGALARGAEALRLVDQLQLQAEAPPGAGPALPERYWSVTPAGAADDGSEQLVLHGAVLLQVAGRADGAAAAAADDGAAEAPPLAPELQAALQQPPERPLRTVWGLMRQDGLLGPWVLGGAAAMAAALTLLELLLFRGLLDVRWALGLPQQRLGALLALMALLGVLALVELPLLGEALRYGRHLELRLRMALLRKLPVLEDRYFQSRPVSDMAERGHSLHLARGLPLLGLHGVQLGCDLLCTLAGIALLDVHSLAAAAGVALLALAVPALVQPLLNERDLRVRSHAGALQVFNLDALLGLVPIRTHGAQDVVRRQHEGLLVQWWRSARGLAALALGAQAVQSLACLGGVAWLLWQHFARSGGSVSGADLLLVYWTLKLPALGGQIAALAQQYPALRNTLLRLLEPLQAPGAPADAAPAAPPATPVDARAAAPRGVALAIHDGQVLAGGHTVLDGLQLQVQAGEQVAIVGASGAGKSSLLGLLLGWHRLAQGRLLVDGQVADADALEHLRHCTAWVDPATQLWNRPLLDNLEYASDGASGAQLGQALERSRLRELLGQLPQGLQTPLGEGGARLSGGEGQRVRLARALVQQPVRLALLDEPFRGLDRARREALLAELRQAWPGATLLCVTHDVAETLGFARVLVVQDGRIVEDGAPVRLAQGDTRYRALLQAERTVREQLWGGAVWRRLRLQDGRLREGAQAVAQEAAHPAVPGEQAA